MLLRVAMYVVSVTFIWTYAVSYLKSWWHATAHTIMTSGITSCPMTSDGDVLDDIRMAMLMAAALPMPGSMQTVGCFSTAGGNIYDGIELFNADYL